MSQGDLVSLVVYNEKGYLLVETASKNLRLPICALYKDEDFVAAAKRFLDKVMEQPSLFCM
jgi:hypothetical protein